MEADGGRLLEAVLDAARHALDDGAPVELNARYLDALAGDLSVRAGRDATITSSQSSTLYYTDPDACSSYVFTAN